MLAYRQVRGGNSTQFSAHGGKADIPEARQYPNAGRLASQAIVVFTLEKAALARSRMRLMQQQAVRATRLIAVMLDDSRLPQHRTDDHRSDAWAGYVDDICIGNPAEQLIQIRLPYNSKRERGVVECSAGCLRDYGDRDSLRYKAPRQNHRIRFDTADIWSEAIRINEDLHGCSRYRPSRYACNIT